MLHNKSNSKLFPENDDVRKIISKLWSCYNSTQDRHVAEILVMCYTGLRVSEFLKLKKSDYHEKCLRVGSSKNGSSRTVPVPYIIDTLLTRLLDDPREYIYADYKNDCFKATLVKYDLPQMIPHATRHIYIMMCTLARVDKKIMEYILGIGLDDNESPFTDVGHLCTQVDKLCALF